MPRYDFRCSRCGPFEVRAELSVVGGGAACPSCGALAVRMFSAPGGRVPRRQRQLEGLSDTALRRVDRVQAGVPSSGGLPLGARLDGGGRPLMPRSGRDDRRPWQLGH